MQTLHKYAEEVRGFNFDFRKFAEIKAGETIASVTGVVASPQVGDEELTIGTPTISGSKVRFTISGGESGGTYELACTIVTSGGATVVGKGTLVIDV